MDTGFVSAHAYSNLSSSPVPYTIKPVEINFQNSDDPTLVSLVNTRFLVDHDEPRGALEVAKKTKGA